MKDPARFRKGQRCVATETLEFPVPIEIDGLHWGGGGALLEAVSVAADAAHAVVAAALGSWAPPPERNIQAWIAPATGSADSPAVAELEGILNLLSEPPHEINKQQAYQPAKYLPTVDAINSQILLDTGNQFGSTPFRNVAMVR